MNATSDIAYNNYWLAMDYLGSAEQALARGDVRFAVYAVYHSAELAVMAFLALEGRSSPRNRQTLIGQFGRVFVVEKQIFAPEQGRLFNRLSHWEQKARSDWSAELTNKMAAEGIALARDLAVRLNQYLADTADTSTDDSDEQKDNP